MEKEVKEFLDKNIIKPIVEEIEQNIDIKDDKKWQLCFLEAIRWTNHNTIRELRQTIPYAKKQKHVKK